MRATLGRRQRLGMALALAALSLLPMAASSRSASAAGSNGDPVTVHGTGRFAGLTVNVSQTSNLINQVIRITWSGATPTTPAIGAFDQDYLQIMQCWGNDPNGPTREQCQFGGDVGDSRGGAWAASRQVSYGHNLVDPQETIRQAPGGSDQAYVPFTSVDGKTDTGIFNEFYDQYSTNEIPFGRTGTDGTGLEYFETETAREAPGLGCGQIVQGSDGTTTGQPCWLVIVPRDNQEVDGTSLPFGQPLASSPLSASNWTHRIVVPLHFQPVGVTCPIGSAERRSVGQEMISEAFTRWQPALCDASKTVYGFSQVNDAIGRQQLLGDGATMAFVSAPVDPGKLSRGETIDYAPVAANAMVFAFSIDTHAASKAPAEVKQHEGHRITSLNLTPRLVAKLLTQSYRLGVDPADNALLSNPLDLTRDPEFLALNPGFRDLLIPGIGDMLMPLGQTDAISELWSWINQDQDARAFLDGRPDPWGMVVNSNYRAVDLPRPDFPKSDPYCRSFTGIPKPLCTLDAHPYAADMHDAARSVARGDSQSRSVWDPTATPPVWKKGPLQLSGGRFLIAFTDAATAARYDLPVASIRNEGRALVQPTSSAMLAALKAMKPDPASGMLLPDPGTADPAAYPLTSLTYAAVPTSTLDAKARSDYAALLDYAVGAGQTPGLAPGNLPAGYVPLPSGLRKETQAVAADLRRTPPSNPSGPGSGTIHVPSSSGSTAPGGGTSAPTSPASRADTQSAGASSSAAIPHLGAAPGKAARGVAAAPPLTMVAVRTPSDHFGPARLILLGLLGLGGLAVGAGVLLPRLPGRGGG